MVEKEGYGREVNLLVLIYYEMSSTKVEDLLKEVVVEMGLLESGGLERMVDVNGSRMSGYVVPLDTKYYSAEFTLLTFDGFAAFDEWWMVNRDRQKIAASIVYVDTGDMLKHFLQTLKALGEFNERTNVETQVLLTSGDPISSLSHALVVQELCNQQCIEVIEMQPTEETKRELNEYNETFGIKRLVEVLCTVDWLSKNRKSSIKIAEIGPTSGTNGTSNTVSKSITIDFGDFLSATPLFQEMDGGLPWPSAEDEVAILKYFGSILQDSSAFPLMENDQTNGDSKKKKKKSKKSKQKSSVEDDSKAMNTGETKPDSENSPSTRINGKPESPLSREESIDEPENSKTTVLLTDILEDVLKISDGGGKSTNNPECAVSGGKHKKVAAEVPTKKHLKNNIAPVLSQLNELKQQAQLLDGEERISLASRVSMSVWEKIANEDDSDDREE